MSESDNNLPDLVKEIENSPKSWLPALLELVIGLSVEKGTFKDISKYCERVIADKFEKATEYDKMSEEEIEQVVTAVFEPVAPPEALNANCLKCGHIRPISPNGVCYECLRKGVHE